MKSIQSELKRIKKFIEDKIKAEDFRLPREPGEDEDIFNTPLVLPKVALGNLPHVNFSLYGQDVNSFGQAPYFLVGYEEAEFDDEGERLDVLIQACCYTVDAYAADEDGIRFPDNMGVVDVTTMLERLKQWIEADSNFPHTMSIKIGSYATTAYTYPYNYGFLSFRLTTAQGTINNKKHLFFMED